MWSQNALTKRLNLEWPMRPWATRRTRPRRGSQQRRLGGLGMSGLHPDNVRRRIEGFRQLSGGSLNVNYPGRHPTTFRRNAATLQTLYDKDGLGPVPEPRLREAGWIRIIWKFWI